MYGPESSIMTATTHTTEEKLKGLYPDQSFPYKEAVPSALILDPRVSTIAGAIEGDAPVIRVPYVKSDPEAGFVKEGAEIQESDGQLDEVLVRTGKIATIIRQSNESASFSTATELIAAGVSRSIVTKADSAFLTNAKAGSEDEQNGPVGLLNVDGLNVIEATESTLVDSVADAKATIGTNNGTPTAIIVNFKTEATLRKLKDNTKKALLIDPTKADALMLHGLPVIINKAMPDNTMFVVSAAEIIAAVGNVKLAASGDALFSYDSIQRRATWRIGYKPVHADRLAKITITE